MPCPAAFTHKMLLQERSSAVDHSCSVHCTNITPIQFLTTRWHSSSAKADSLLSASPKHQTHQSSQCKSLQKKKAYTANCSGCMHLRATLLSHVASFQHLTFTPTNYMIVFLYQATGEPLEFSVIKQLIILLHPLLVLIYSQNFKIKSYT